MSRGMRGLLGLLRDDDVDQCYLDDFTTGMVSAHGTRQIVSTYTGPLIRVFRDSDSTQTDIDALPNGKLDIASLLAFVGGGSGYVIVYYDQVGSVDFGHTTAGALPWIVDTGVLESKGGFPGVSFPSGESRYLREPSGNGATQPYTILQVGSTDGGDSGVHYMHGTYDSVRSDIAADGALAVPGNEVESWVMYGGAWLYGLKTSFNSDPTCLWSVFNGASSVLSANGEVITGDAGSSNPTRFILGNNYQKLSAATLKGHHFERIMWSGDRGAYRVDAEKLVGKYYGISINRYTMQIEASADDYSPAESGTVTITATITNASGYAATGVVASAPIPTGLTYSADTPDTGSYSAATGLWTIGNLAAGVAAEIEIECTVTGSDGDDIEYPISLSAVTDVSNVDPSTVTVPFGVGPLNTRATTYQSATADIVPIGGEPEGDWSAGQGASDSDYTYILPGRAVRQDCVASSARLWIKTLGTGSWKLKHFRWSGATFAYQGERAITPSTTGSQTVTFAALTLTMGDVIGIYVPSDGELELIECDLDTGVCDASGDITADNAFSEITDGIPLDVYSTRPYLAATGDSMAAGRHGGAGNYWDCWLWEEDLDVIPGGEPTSEVWNQMRADAADLAYQNHALGSMEWSWVVSTGMPRVAACTPHTLVIICGTNDIFNDRTWGATELHLDAIKVLADAAGIQRLAICEILPRTTFDDTDAATIRTWNANYATWCKRNGAQFVTCHDAMGMIRVSTSEYDDLETAFDAGDGVHLSTAGVEALSELIQDQI